MTKWILLMAAVHTSASPVQIVAHRGAMHDRPENTMAAFEHAVELGADILEVDVRTSADGVLFVLHDSTLDRTTDGEGRASDLTFAELQALDAGGWFDAAYTGARIPALAAVLQSAKGRAQVLLDLKESGEEFADAVAEAVQTHGDPATVIVGVRSPRQAREFRARMPGSRQLAFMRSPDDIDAYAEAGVDIIRLWLRWAEADPELTGRVRDAGKTLMINGRHGDIDEARSLIKHAPDWILIDNITQLQESLEALAAESATTP